LPIVAGPRELVVYTQVQSDRTADSIRLILDDMAAFATDKGVDETELQRVTDGNIRGLPNSYETNGQVLSALLDNKLLGRPDTYQASLPQLYRAIDAGQIDAAARSYLSPDGLVIVVVGDRKQIDDQLATLGMEIEYLDADAL
jgi:predicted Zn-dependent peptidase